MFESGEKTFVPFLQGNYLLKIPDKPGAKEIELIRERLRTKLKEGREIFLCRLCKARVTTSWEKMKMHGRHIHDFVNPAGFTFRIRCFSDAPGAAGIGISTMEFTWFPGFAWKMAVCRGCGTHLGWTYSSENGKVFWGLIARNLIKGNSVNSFD